MSVNDIVDLISGIGTLILSTLAFIFSIYAFRKVSLKTEFKRKQLDTVYELIEILQDTIISISFHTPSNHPVISTGTLFRFFRLYYSEDKYMEFNNTKVLLVTQDPDREFEFIKFSEHPYMVPEIASIIREFVAYTYDPININKLDSFTVLGATGLSIFDDKYYQITDNPVYNNLDSFCKKCIELDKAIHKWLKGIGIEDFNKKEIIE